MAKAENKERESEEGERKRDKINDFLKTNFEKGEMAIKHAVGLGAQPNAVPVAKPKMNCSPRPVEVGWHPVGGAAGKWFAEDTGLGKMITERINRYPDPTQHWAILVGDYAHQLWMDENFDVIYTNEKVKREEWQTFKVGETRFNDDATRRAGEEVIASIREKQPAYNLITNNCQTYALQLLDAIKVGDKKEFGTTLAVYERLTGPGKVMDLFAAPVMQSDDGTSAAGQDHSVSYAQQVMNEHTTQLDPREETKKRSFRLGRKAKKGDDPEQVERERARQEKIAGEGKEKEKEKTDYKEKVMSFFKRS